MRHRQIPVLAALLMLVLSGCDGGADTGRSTGPPRTAADTTADHPSEESQRHVSLDITDYHFGGGAETTPALFARALTFWPPDWRVIVRLEGTDARGRTVHLGQSLGVLGRMREELWSTELAVPLSLAPEGRVVAIFEFQDASGEKKTEFRRELQLPE
jgi:hypothetical protein